MTDQYVGQITVVAFDFAPSGWAFCDGQVLPISQYEALATLIGNRFGGNGTTNFALPNLQSRVPIGQGSGYTLGGTGGEESHVLATGELPSHTHLLMASSATATVDAPGNSAYLAATKAARGAAGGPEIYATPGTTVALATGALASTGGGQGHENRQPFLALNYIIALSGTFPAQN